jgi:UDP-GlcNAc:undecaprenyl-phosphate GlcNAc-1-phosphate transferase
MRLGHGPRRTVVILWLWTALLSGLALLPAYTEQGNALVPVGVLALALLLYALFFPGRQPLPAEPVAEEPVAEPEHEELGEVVDLDSRRRHTG